MTRHVAAISFVFVIGVATPNQTRAQTEQDFAIWAALFFTGQIYQDSPSPVFWLDVQAREGAISTLTAVRPGVGLAFAPWGSLWLGYASFTNWIKGVDERTNENRIWEQLILAYRNDNILLLSRTRTEQRFLKQVSGMANRFRQMVRLNYRPNERVPVGIAFKDEVFFQFGGDAWATQGFEQQRAFLGLTIFPFERLIRIEVGYLNIYQRRDVANQLTHALSLNFFVYYKGKQYWH